MAVLMSGRAMDTRTVRTLRHYLLATIHGSALFRCSRCSVWLGSVSFDPVGLDTVCAHPDSEMAGRHRCRPRSIQIIRTGIVAAKDTKRPDVQQFHVSFYSAFLYRAFAPFSPSCGRERRVECRVYSQYGIDVCGDFLLPGWRMFRHSTDPGPKKPRKVDEQCCIS